MQGSSTTNRRLEYYRFRRKKHKITEKEIGYRLALVVDWYILAEDPCSNFPMIFSHLTHNEVVSLPSRVIVPTNKYLPEKKIDIFAGIFGICWTNTLSGEFSRNYELWANASQ